MTTSDRLLGVLGLFTIERPEWTVEEAASEMRLAASTTYRYFRSLSKAGLIVAFATGRYVLGPAIIQFDRQIRLRDPLITAAQPLMKQLSEALPANSLILLCRVFRNQVMSVHQESIAKLDFAVSYQRGRAMPMFRGASSKIILAHMPVRNIKALYDEHGAALAKGSLGKDWDEVKERLRGFRNAGFVMAQGEVDPGMCGIAVPIFEPAGGIIGSLSLVTPLRVLTPELLEKAPPMLRAVAEQVQWTLSLGVSGTKPASEASIRPTRAKAGTTSRAAKAAALANVTKRATGRVRPRRASAAR